VTAGMPAAQSPRGRRRRC